MVKHRLHRKFLCFEMKAVNQSLKQIQMHAEIVDYVDDKDKAKPTLRVGFRNILSIAVEAWEENINTYECKNNTNKTYDRKPSSRLASPTSMIT